MKWKFIIDPSNKPVYHNMGRTDLNITHDHPLSPQSPFKMLGLKNTSTILVLCWTLSNSIMVKDKQLRERKIDATFTDLKIDPKVNFRGLAIHESSVWIGGSEGFMMRLKNGGQMHGNIEIAKDYDIRDIAIFDEAEIVILGAGPKAR